MNDLLYVSFDFDEETKKKALCVGRPNPDGSHTILNMLEGDMAMAVYGCLTNRIKFTFEPPKEESNDKP